MPKGEERSGRAASDLTIFWHSDSTLRFGWHEAVESVPAAYLSTVLLMKYFEKNDY